MKNTRDEKIFPFKIKFLEEDLVIYNRHSNEYLKNKDKETLSIHKKIEEALFNKLNKAQNSKYSIYFYTLRNLILPDYPNRSECEVELILEPRIKAKYFQLQFCHIYQEYELFFTQFEELEYFYKTLYEKLIAVERLFFLNNSSRKNDNYQYVQKLKAFNQPQEKF